MTNRAGYLAVWAIIVACVLCLTSCGAGVMKTTLNVEGNVSGARVFLDGKEVGITPTARIEALPGEHHVEVLKEGYEVFQRTVQALPGEAVTLQVTLVEFKERFGILYIDTEPGEATVKVLGHNQIFSQGMELPPGQYHLELSADGYESKNVWTEIEAGEDKRLAIKLVKKPLKELDAVLVLSGRDANGARVYIDGLEVGTMPADEIRVSEGKRFIRVEKEGFESFERVIDLVPGESVSLYVDLTSVQPSKGRLHVETEPKDARIRVMNIVPKFQQGMSLDPGTYDIEITATGHESRRFDVEIAPGEDKRLSIRLEPETVSNISHKKLTNTLGMDFIWISAGEYMRGSPCNETGRDSDEHQHRVILTRGFYIQTTEVTQGQWKTVMGMNPSYFKSGDDYPVERVSWNDVQKFIKKLNSMDRRVKYRLPTEAEWEYAARSGSKTRFHFGDDEERLMEYAWFGLNSENRSHPVGKKKPNDWGLYDMHGNVCEWVSDWYGDYPAGSVTDPIGPSSGSSLVYRGGNWFGSAWRCRSALRNWHAPEISNIDLGFRLAASQ